MEEKNNFITQDNMQVFQKKASKIDNLLDEKPTYIGFPFPLKKRPEGFFSPYFDVDLIKADLIQLIMTEPGERVMLPEFGVGIRRIMFEPSVPDLYAQIRNNIIQAIERWERRIVVNSIEVKPYIDENGNSLEEVIYIAIKFSVKEDLKNEFNLNLRINNENFKNKT